MIQKLREAVRSNVARRRLSIDEYELLVRDGTLSENDRVELIHGEISEKMAIGPQHSSCVTRCNRWLLMNLGDRVIVRIQDPVRLIDSEPEPDVCVARWREDNYVAGHPTSADILLLIEVADSSLDYDRSVKLGMYAAAGVSEYWILDLNDRRLEVYRQPRLDGTYGDAASISVGDEVESLAFPGLRIPLVQIFP